MYSDHRSVTRYVPIYWYIYIYVSDLSAALIAHLTSAAADWREYGSYYILPYVAAAIGHWSCGSTRLLLLACPARGCEQAALISLSENEMQYLCLKSTEIFLSQPMLLELQAPITICGEYHLKFPLQLVEFVGQIS